MAKQWTYFCWPFCAFDCIFLGVGGDDFVSFNFFRCFLRTHFVLRGLFLDCWAWIKRRNRVDFSTGLQLKRLREDGEMCLKKGSLARSQESLFSRCYRRDGVEHTGGGPWSLVTRIALYRPLAGVVLSLGFSVAKRVPFALPWRLDRIPRPCCILALQLDNSAHSSFIRYERGGGGGMKKKGWYLKKLGSCEKT